MSLFIPKKIKVGYQERNDTYTKRLAYVTYFDNKGVLRQEISWEGWRDKKIKPNEYDNIPQSGFILNKDVKRCNWNHFGSSRSYIRIYDPRGIEFEITPENLIGLLMETTCSKRGLEGEFVYAWAGKNLVLLPITSEAYQQAVVYTNRQDQKVSAKTLKPGCSYTTKQGKEVIYLGRFPCFEWGSRLDKPLNKKQHVFWDVVKPQYDTQLSLKNDASFLASLNNPDPVQNYAELMDQFRKDFRSTKIVGWETQPTKVNLEMVFDPRRYSNPYLERGRYCKKEGGTITFFEIFAEHKSKYNGYTSSGGFEIMNQGYTFEFIGYKCFQVGTLNTKTLLRTDGQNDNYRFQDRHNKNYLSADEVSKQLADVVDVFMVLENGKKLLVNGFMEFVPPEGD